MTEITEHRRNYLKNYIKKKYKSFILMFDKEKEKDIIDFLNGKENRIAYIRNLIKVDMDKE